jgi:hypothetical protein
MQAFLDGLQSVGIFLLFLLGRFMLLLLVLALLSAVFFVGLTLVRAVLYLRARALGLTKVAGLRWRAGLHYSPGHTWVEIKPRNGARIGFEWRSDCSPVSAIAAGAGHGVAGGRRPPRCCAVGTAR